MKITLPNNTFGALIMIAAILLWIIVSFTVPLWLTLMIAPWWVAVPVALLVALIAFITCVKFKD